MIDENTLVILLRQANRMGYEGKRFVSVMKKKITATDKPEDEFILMFDDGPTKATESWG